MEQGDSLAGQGDATGGRRLPLADLRKKDLNLLVVLAALLEGNSVSEAAKRLDSTQPSTSRMLERLRDEIGDPLLIKSALKMLPTRRAQELQPMLDNVLRLIEQIYTQAADYDPALETGSYAIGINDSLQAVIAPGFLEALRHTAPRARVRMQPVPLPSGVSALSSGAIDVMVAFHPAEEHESLRAELLFNAQFGCLCATGNRQISDHPTPAELAPLPCLDVSQFGLVTKLIDRYFGAHGTTRNIVGTLTSYLAVADAVAGHGHVCDGARLPRPAAVPSSRRALRTGGRPAADRAGPSVLAQQRPHAPFVSVLRTLLTQAAAPLAH